MCNELLVAGAAAAAAHHMLDILLPLTYLPIQVVGKEGKKEGSKEGSKEGRKEGPSAAHELTANS